MGLTEQSPSLLHANKYPPLQDGTKKVPFRLLKQSPSLLKANGTKSPNAHKMQLQCLSSTDIKNSNMRRDFQNASWKQHASCCEHF